MTADCEDEKLCFCDLDDRTAGLRAQVSLAALLLLPLRKPGDGVHAQAPSDAVHQRVPLCLAHALRASHLHAHGWLSGHEMEKVSASLPSLCISSNERFGRRAIQEGVPQSFLAACRQPDLDWISESLPTKLQTS